MHSFIANNEGSALLATRPWHVKTYSTVVESVSSAHHRRLQLRLGVLHFVLRKGEGELILILLGAAATASPTITLAPPFQRSNFARAEDTFDPE